ncbi:MAG: type I-B CRISPR-associated protein Cas7/Cst2/DevR [Anaerolineae bacterium]
MAFVTGLLLVDAPASALNNLGGIPGEQDQNTVGVKMIRTKGGAYPYVSAQAFRYWLRQTLARTGTDLGLTAAPIFREMKVAYTDANPILYWDDDLLGYMRAPSTKTDAVKARSEDASRAQETPTSDTITRVSPFRVGTLVSIGPANIIEDFGVMARHEGDPVPHVHQFYRATLQGLYSLDLAASGTFSYRQKTGFRNLDPVRVDLAKQNELEELQEQKAYRLPRDERVKRISALLDGIAQLEGGAKQTLHYTDVSPVVTFAAITKGGNHIFGHIIGCSLRGEAVLKLDALEEALTVYEEEILSPVYVGWCRGFCDEERAKLEDFAAQSTHKVPIVLAHPREAMASLIADLRKAEHSRWLD